MGTATTWTVATRAVATRAVATRMVTTNARTCMQRQEVSLGTWGQNSAIGHEGWRRLVSNVSIVVSRQVRFMLVILCQGFFTAGGCVEILNASASFGYEDHEAHQTQKP